MASVTVDTERKEPMSNDILRIVKLHENAVIPKRGTDGSAGYDLFVPTDSDDIIIKPHQTVKVHTNIAMEIPRYVFGAIFARSGTATKRGLRPANCVGVVDPDYRGDIIVALHNDTDVDQKIEAGERIAQIVFVPFMLFDFELVDKLDETERGAGGFGSTGFSGVMNAEFEEIPGQTDIFDYLVHI